MEAHGITISFSGVTDEDFFQRQFNTELSRVTVLSGGNNAGKTLLLKELHKRSDVSTFYFGTSRFYDASALPQDNPNDRATDASYHESVLRHTQSVDQNLDPVTRQFGQVFMAMLDTERESLYTLINECLGQEAGLQYRLPGNRLSSPVLAIGDTPLNRCSSGSRVLAYILSVLLSQRYKYILLDEPELALTPGIQSWLMAKLVDRSDSSFEHLEHVFIATHSHIFLSPTISDNFIVRRQGPKIKVSQIGSGRQLNELRFQQLGNSLEHLQLPSGFLVVEGPTDAAYLERLIRLRIANSRVKLINARSDSGTSTVVHQIKQVVGDLAPSPYGGRVLVLLDDRHGPGLQATLESQGVGRDEIIIWSKNGIEYYYPLSILRDIFGNLALEIEQLDFDKDRITNNGVTKTKKELQELVLERLSGNEELHEELESLLERVKQLS